jgi:hypothetical protein
MDKQFGGIDPRALQETESRMCSIGSALPKPWVGFDDDETKQNRLLQLRKRKAKARVSNVPE